MDRSPDKVYSYSNERYDALAELRLQSEVDSKMDGQQIDKRCTIIQEKADKQAEQKTKQAENQQLKKKYEREKEGEIKNTIKERLQIGRS